MVAGSTRQTLPASFLLTQTDPSPTATVVLQQSIVMAPMSVESMMMFVVMSRRETVLTSEIQTACRPTTASVGLWSSSTVTSFCEFRS